MSDYMFSDCRGYEGRLSDSQRETLSKYVENSLITDSKQVRIFIEKEFGIRYSKSGAIRQLQELGFRYKQTSFLPSKMNPEKQAAFKTAYNEFSSQLKMDDAIFKNLTNNYDNIKTTVVDGLKDTSIFDINSVKLIYSLPKDSYILIADTKKNIYLTKILNVKFNKLNKNSNIEKQYIFKGNNEIKENLYISYDLYINTKYKVKLNEKTLERVKNYFN